MNKTKEKKAKNKNQVRDFKGTWKKLYLYVSKYKVRIIGVVILSILSSIITIITPKISGNAITKLSEGSALKIAGLNIDTNSILYILCTLFVLYTVMAFSSCISSYIITEVSVKITYGLRQDVSKKISRIPLSYFDSINYGEVLSRVTNDIDILSSTLTQSICQVISSILMLFGILYMMFSISWQMSLVSIGILPISAVLVSFIVKKSQKYFREYQAYLGHINGHIEEMFSGHDIVKAYNGENESIKKFIELNNTMYKSSWKSQFLSGLISAFIGLISNLSYISVCLVGGYLAVSNGLSIGDISAFIVYSNQFMSPLIQVANISNILQQTAAAAERVFDFLEIPEEPDDSANPINIGDQADGLTKSNTICINGRIKFENVYFGYTPDKFQINNLSFEIAQGKTTAIVGSTGSGKTTLIKLLTGFYRINKGSIYIDGYDIYKFKKEELRSLFGIVLQDAWLYNDTIMENIRYGNLTASDQEVIEAAKLSYADHFIRTLPDGYSTVLNESTSNISEGEKQLITIARTILSNPKILILDEATSSVDTRTEVHIQNAVNQVLKGRTSLVIAHRLSTIRNADNIVVIDKGSVAEQGTHPELVNKNGLYAELYKSQFIR